MPPDDPITEVRISLGRIEGMLSVKHIEYDRRLTELERRTTGALGKAAAVISPVIAFGSLLFVVASRINWA